MGGLLNKGRASSDPIGILMEYKRVLGALLYN